MATYLETCSRPCGCVVVLVFVEDRGRWRLVERRRDRFCCRAHAEAADAAEDGQRAELPGGGK